MRTLAVPVELLEKIAADYESLSRSLDYKPERIACGEIASDVRALLAAPGVGEQPAKTNREIDSEIRAKALRIARTYPGGLQAWLKAAETPAPEER